MTQNNTSIFIDNIKIFIGGVSVKGIEKTINQDSYRIGGNSENELAYIIVADGLGSCKSSDQGSERIVQIVENWILNKLPDYAFLSDNVANILSKRMFEEWNSSFDGSMHDFDTTVHVALYYKGSILIGGIGDGMLLFEYDDIECRDFIDDKNLFSNITNSMCSLNADELMDFQVISSDYCKNHATVIISTDGIADDLIPEKKNTLPEYFKHTLDTDGMDSLQNELQDWIINWRTDAHSDDKTLCYLVIEKD